MMSNPRTSYSEESVRAIFSRVEALRPRSCYSDRNTLGGCVRHGRGRFHSDAVQGHRGVEVRPKHAL